MDPQQLRAAFQNMGITCAKVCGTFAGWGVVPISGCTFFPLFDQLFLIRSFEEFIMDLYDEPDMIKEILDKNTPAQIAQNLAMTKDNPIKRMHAYAMRSDAAVLSPDLFTAAQILDGYHSFRGDVPATMLAMGTADEVAAYCEKLITETGLKTPGFMLGTCCEVPLNCKPEPCAIQF